MKVSMGIGNVVLQRQIGLLYIWRCYHISSELYRYIVIYGGGKQRKRQERQKR